MGALRAEITGARWANTDARNAAHASAQAPLAALGANSNQPAPARAVGETSTRNAVQSEPLNSAGGTPSSGSVSYRSHAPASSTLLSISQTFPETQMCHVYVQPGKPVSDVILWQGGKITGQGRVPYPLDVAARCKEGLLRVRIGTPESDLITGACVARNGTELRAVENSRTVFTPGTIVFNTREADLQWEVIPPLNGNDITELTRGTHLAELTGSWVSQQGARSAALAEFCSNARTNPWEGGSVREHRRLALLLFLTQTHAGPTGSAHWVSPGAARAHTSFTQWQDTARFWDEAKVNFADALTLVDAFPAGVSHVETRHLVAELAGLGNT
jgi:hypothetical protein